MESDSEEKPVLVAEIAKELNVSRHTVYRAIRSGQLAALRIGQGRGTLRITPAARDAYLAACREAATTP